MWVRKRRALRSKAWVIILPGRHANHFVGVKVEGGGSRRRSPGTDEIVWYGFLYQGVVRCYDDTEGRARIVGYAQYR